VDIFAVSPQCRLAGISIQNKLAVKCPQTT
jgi:hypothetical protein